MSLRQDTVISSSERIGTQYSGVHCFEKGQEKKLKEELSCPMHPEKC